MINIALLGLGTVGEGVYEIIKNTRKDYFSNMLNIKWVMVRNKEKAMSKGVDEAILTCDFNDILNDDEISTVVAVTGAGNTEYDFIKQSLLNKKNVVTANKEIIALHMDELLEIANRNKVKLMFEAAVGGGIPIIASVIETVKLNHITKIYGILNGTTNYILTKMNKEKSSFSEVLKQAQELGFAEADPTADIEGYDVMRKISILSSIAFKTMIKQEDIHVRGISNITKEDIEFASSMGYNIKFFAQGLNIDGGYSVSVTPVFLKENSVVSNVDEEYNIIVIYGDIIGQLCFMGKGAGKEATADAVVHDVLKVIANDSSYDNLTFNKNVKSSGLNGITNEYYIRADIDTTKVFDDILDLVDGYISKNKIYYQSNKLFFITEKISSIKMKELYMNLNNISSNVFYARLQNEMIWGRLKYVWE